MKKTYFRVHDEAHGQTSRNTAVFPDNLALILRCGKDIYLFKSIDAIDVGIKYFCTLSTRATQNVKHICMSNVS